MPTYATSTVAAPMPNSSRTSANRPSSSCTGIATVTIRSPPRSGRGCPAVSQMTDPEILEHSVRLSDAQELVARRMVSKAGGAQDWIVHHADHADAPSTAKVVITSVEPELFVTDIAASCDFSRQARLHRRIHLRRAVLLWSGDARRRAAHVRHHDRDGRPQHARPSRLIGILPPRRRPAVQAKALRGEEIEVRARLAAGDVVAGQDRFRSAWRIPASVRCASAGRRDEEVTIAIGISAAAAHPAVRPRRAFSGRPRSRISSQARDDRPC